MAMAASHNFYSILNTAAAETPETDVPPDAVSPLLGLPPELLPPILEHLRSQNMFYTLSKVRRTCRVVASLVDEVLLREIKLAELRVSVVAFYRMLRPRNRFRFIRVLEFGPRRKDDSQAEQEAKCLLLESATRVEKLEIDPSTFDEPRRPKIWQLIGRSVVRHLCIPDHRQRVYQLFVKGLAPRFRGVAFPPTVQVVELNNTYMTKAGERPIAHYFKDSFEALATCAHLSFWTLECEDLDPSLFDHPVLISKIKHFINLTARIKPDTPVDHLFAHEEFHPSHMTLMNLPAVNFPAGVRHLRILDLHYVADLDLPRPGLDRLDLCDPMLRGGHDAAAFYDWLMRNKGCRVRIYWTQDYIPSSIASILGLWREVFWNYLPVEHVEGFMPFRM